MSAGLTVPYMGEPMERRSPSGPLADPESEDLDCASHPVCRVGADGTLRAVNAAWRGRWTSRGEAPPVAGDRYAPGDDPLAVAEQLRSALVDGPVEWTCRCDHALEAEVAIRLEAVGTVEDRSVLAQHWDVTAERQAERRRALAFACARASIAGAGPEEIVRAICEVTGWEAPVSLAIQGSRVHVTPVLGGEPWAAPAEPGSLAHRARERERAGWDADLSTADELLGGPPRIGRRRRAACVVPVGEEGEVVVFFSLRKGRPDGELLAEVERSLAAGRARGAARPRDRRPVDIAVGRASASDATVLLLGESGTGKTRLARAIHEASGRAGRPFLDLNCAGLGATLLESELFGHERGAFTGAHQRKRGLLELATGGTILLDEIGELDPIVQAKLLKVLETRAFRRVGGETELKVDVRFIAATNRDLRAEVRARRFREDLFYRLNVLEIRLPPLRERRSEIPALASGLLAAMSERPTVLTDEARRVLSGHPWPGNIRELRNVLERAVLSTSDGIVDVDALDDLLPADRPQLPGALLSELTRQRVVEVLDLTGGNVRRAAVELGIARSTLYEWIRRDGLDTSQWRKQGGQR